MFSHDIETTRIANHWAPRGRYRQKWFLQQHSRRTLKTTCTHQVLEHLGEPFLPKVFFLAFRLPSSVASDLRRKLTHVLSQRGVVWFDEISAICHEYGLVTWQPFTNKHATYWWKHFCARFFFGHRTRQSKSGHRGGHDIFAGSNFNLCAFFAQLPAKNNSLPKQFLQKFTPFSRLLASYADILWARLALLPHGG